MRLVVFALLLSLLAACSPQRYVAKEIRSAEGRFQDHIGFYLYDPATRKVLADHQASRYFTPASNTKILTLFASLTLLGDSIPALRFTDRGDSLIIWGTGDPTLFYNQVNVSNPVYSFLSTTAMPIYFSSSNFREDRFGPGWAWDDFNASYSPERSALPVFGNVIEIQVDEQTVRVAPDHFHQYVREEAGNGRTRVERLRGEANDVVVKHGTRNVRDWIIPFRADDSVIARLLADTLKKSIPVIDEPLLASFQTLWTTPADSVYKVMMQQSDNFLAEQLLLACAGKIADTLQTQIAIDYLLKNHLSDLPDRPVWVDGSGLSRYNLNTPRSLGRLWEKLLQTYPRERLFPLLATGGQPGTLRNWYVANPPFVFGKTGSLANNHALSGYLITRKNKTLVFALMNANFTQSSNEVRTWMQSLLTYIRDHY